MRYLKSYIDVEAESKRWTSVVDFMNHSLNASMRYLLRINEAVNNLQLLRSYVKDMVLEIFKVYKITGDNLHRHQHGFIIL